MIEPISPQQVFSDFLQQYFPAEAETLLNRFELYLQELYSWNAQVNLVSRRMAREEYWTYHFLDSLLVLNCMDIKGGEVLDFGTGGGLPGIPLKIVRPEIKLTLLDSVGKKIRCLEEIIAALDLTDCRAVWSRLEDYASGSRKQGFDYVLCRSVRLEEAFRLPLQSLLKPSGKVIFYKGQHLDDVANLPQALIYDVSHPALGTRHIVAAPCRSFA